MWRLILRKVMTYTETLSAPWIDMERAHLALDIQDLADLQSSKED